HRLSVMVNDGKEQRILRGGFPHQVSVEGGAIGERSFGQVAPQPLLVLPVSVLPQAVAMSNQAEWRQVDVLPFPAKAARSRRRKGADQLADWKIALGLFVFRH